MGYGGFSRGGGVALPPSAMVDGTSEEVFWWEDGGHKRPLPSQAESVGAAQGLGLRPARGGPARAPHGEIMPREDAEVPVGRARVGWRAPGRVHGRASMKET